MDLKAIITASNLGSTSRLKKVAFGISFFFHLLFFLAAQQFFPVIWHTSELKTYRVELIRDAIDDIPIEKIEKQNREDSLKKVVETDKDSEETISLDTRDTRYVSYARLIKKRLASCWGYPKEAKEQLIEGKSHVIFSLSRDGRLTNVLITGSSGHEILDREGMDAVSRAAPFPPFPGTITVGKLNINVTFDYRLTSTKDAD